MDYKAELIRKCVMETSRAPIFAIEKVEGPPHMPVYTARVSTDAATVTGKGSTKRGAEQEAARLMLNMGSKSGTPQYDSAQDSEISYMLEQLVLSNEMNTRLQKEQENMEAHVSDLEESVAEKTKQIAALQKDVVKHLGLAARNEELEKQNQSLKSIISRNNERIEDLEGDNDVLRVRVAMLENEVAEYISFRQALEGIKSIMEKVNLGRPPTDK